MRAPATEAVHDATRDLEARRAEARARLDAHYAEWESLGDTAGR